MRKSGVRKIKKDEKHHSFCLSRKEMVSEKGV